MTSRFRGIFTIGRLAPGATPTVATAELNRVNDAIAAEVPQFRKTRARVVPLRDDLFGSERAPLTVVLAAALLLLVIASSNALSLGLSDALARRRATAIRLAMGASISYHGLALCRRWRRCRLRRDLRRHSWAHRFWLDSSRSTPRCSASSAISCSGRVKRSSRSSPLALRPRLRRSRPLWQSRGSTSRRWRERRRTASVAEPIGGAASG